MGTQIRNIAERMSSLSARIYNFPADSIDWNEEVEIGRDWFTAPELLSVNGTPLAAKLSEEQLKTLSFWEAVNFYSLNINGELPLVHGLTDRLFKSADPSITNYLHHFIDEENKHMQYFGRFCQKFAGKVYADKKVVFPQEEWAPGEEEFLFFAKVMVFEETADHYNILQGNDERLHPISRRINLLHHQDEARHLAFGRQMVLDLWQQHSKDWGEATLSKVRKTLTNYIESTWKEYYNPEMYKDAGLALQFGSSYDIFQSVYSDPAAMAHRKSVNKKLRSFLHKNDILQETSHDDATTNP